MQVGFLSSYNVDLLNSLVSWLTKREYTCHYRFFLVQNFEMA